jgi:4'-phosphopantetheinyl transferase
MVRWLVQSLSDHPDLAAGRPPAGLLSPAEHERFAGYVNPKRRRDWLLGRWTAKQLIQSHLAAVVGLRPALDSFTVTQDPDGAPYAVSRDPALLEALPTALRLDRLPLVVTISHSHGYAFCAVCEDGDGEHHLGADIELVETRERAFVQDFFSEPERAVLAGAPSAQADLLITAMWSAKESVLKALRMGLRIDTRRVQCLIAPDEPRAWTRFGIELCAPLGKPAATTRVNLPQGEFTGWWRIVENRLRPNSRFVMTLVTQNCTL